MFHETMNHSCASPGYDEGMFAKHPIAEIAGLLADPARVAMLTAVLDGGSSTAGDLARTAGVSPQAASAHLNRLRVAGLVTLEREGRQHYFRMASPEIGIALEALAAVARRAPDGALIPESEEVQALRNARTCYDHLAGSLGVHVRIALESRGLIEPDGHEYVVTAQGEDWFAEQGIDIAAVRKTRRQFARQCRDWTERQHHVGGALGSALLECFLKRKWLVRRNGTRALRVTAEGERELQQLCRGHPVPSNSPGVFISAEEAK